MIVLSTCLQIANQQRVCMRSVEEQTKPVEHKMLCGPEPVCEKLIKAWNKLPDDEIIVWLDGDDYLATDRALEVVQAYHDAGAWVTFGQFIWRSGQVGFAAPLGNHPRREPWRATHLRTFRAGLAKRIRDTDLRDTSGEYAGWVTDRRIMLAVCEMSGPKAVFVPQVLAVYTGDSVYEQTREAVELAAIAAMPEYERVTSLAMPAQSP